MNKSLFFLIAVSVFTVTVESRSLDGAKPRLNFNNLNTLLKDPNFQNHISNGIDLLADLSQTLKNDVPKVVMPKVEMPKIEMLKLDAENVEMPTLNLLSNMSDADFQDLIGLLQVNIEFFINKANISSVVKDQLITVLPLVLNSKTAAEAFGHIEPLVLTGLGVFFQDVSIVFDQYPYVAAGKKFVELYFASPEAPEFLKDPATQAMVLAYIDTAFRQENLNDIINKIYGDVNAYLQIALAQQIKPLIQQNIPDLYLLIENESDITSVLNIVYSYVVTNAVTLYTQVIQLVGSTEQVENIMSLMSKMRL